MLAKETPGMQSRSLILVGATLALLITAPASDAQRRPGQGGAKTGRPFGAPLGVPTAGAPRSPIGASSAIPGSRTQEPGARLLPWGSPTAPAPEDPRSDLDRLLEAHLAGEIDATQLTPAVPEEETWPSLRDLDPVLRELEQRYFTICDHNSNNWIAFREAKLSLGVDRTSYAVYDTDRDGRVTREEFHDRYWSVVAYVGAFQPPREPGSESLLTTGRGASATPSFPPLPTGPSPSEEILANFDLNGDGGMDSGELQVFFSQLRLGDQTPDVGTVMAPLDTDGSLKLEVAELTLLVQYIKAITGDTSFTDEEGNAETEDAVSRLLELVREEELAPRTGAIPRLQAPVSSFRRLDLDADGGISATDLSRLQAPVQTVVRANAVLAALDLDGDGRLDAAEFGAAFD